MEMTKFNTLQSHELDLTFLRPKHFNYVSMPDVRFQLQRTWCLRAGVLLGCDTELLG